MYQRHVLGKRGEEEVCKYLMEQGYRILERNYYCKIGELDIIALDEDEYVFIEVKTRSQNQYGAPVEAVNVRKQKHIYRTAEYYVVKNSLEDQKIRFDVIEVKEEGEKILIHQIKNAILDRPRGGKYDSTK